MDVDGTEGVGGTPEQHQAVTALNIQPEFLTRLFSLLQKRDLNEVHLQTSDVIPARQQELRGTLQSLQ